MSDDLIPCLGGGPADWPHNKTPDHKFVPPWRRAEMIEVDNRELARIQQDYTERTAEIRRIQERTDAMMAAFRLDRSHASSGRAIEARMRRRINPVNGFIDWLNN